MWPLLHYAGACLYSGPFFSFMSTSVNWILFFFFFKIQHLHIMWFCGPPLLSWSWCRIRLQWIGIKWILCLCCTPELEQESRRLFFCFFLIFPVCYSHVSMVKGRINVIKECLSGQMGLNLRLPSEAPEASYLWKAKHKDTPWGNKMSRRAPCLHLWSQFHFIFHPNLSLSLSPFDEKAWTQISINSGEAPRD